VADDALDELSKEARAVANSLKQMGDAAKGAQAPLAGVGESAEDASRSTQVLTHALGELAADGLNNAIDAALRFGPALVEAAAGSERHQMALQQLGAAYGVVQQATNGVVSAEQAAAVQQRALQSGLRLSAQELAAVTARARDFARSTGTDINQALEQLTDQLINPGEELSKFGIRLQQGMEAGDQLREALRQLSEQAGQTGVAQASLSESMEMATRAQREATDALAGFIAQRLELADFFTQFSGWLTQATTDANSFNAMIEAAVGTLTEMIGLRSTAMAPQAQSASGQFTTEAGAIAARLRARGFNLGGVELGRLGVQGTPEQRARILEALQRAERGALEGGAQETLGFAGGRGVTRQQALQQQLRGLTAEIEQTFAEQERIRIEAERATERARRAEINRRNRVSGGGGGGGGRAEAERLASEQADLLTREPFRRLPTDTAGLASFFAGFRPGAERVQAGLGTADIATRSAIERMTSGRSALEALDLTGRRQEGQRQELLARGREDAAGRLQVQTLRERRTALLDLLEANTAYMDQARQANASEQSINDLLTQRIGIQTSLAETTRALTEEQNRFTESQQFVLDKATEVAGVLGGSLVDAAFAAMDAQANAGATFAQVIEDQTRAFLRNLAKQSVVSALQETAKGFGALAIGSPGALGHFKSAGLHAAAAAAAGIGAAAMGPQTSATPAAAGGAAGAGTTTAARADDRQTGGGGGPLTLVVNVSGAAFTDAGVQQAVGSALREAVGTGAIRREHLVGLFGG
jgi:hypothetical protein